MTIIQFKFAVPSKTGEDVPQGGWIECKPTRKRIITGDPDTIILPDSFIVQVPESGLLGQDLAATGSGWCWELTLSGFGVPKWTEYVVVPDAGPVDFTDLVRVDPATLEPTAAPDPLWWAELEAAKALASDVELARVDAAGSATSAAQSATDADVSAGEASGSASNAAASALSASDSAALAGTSADLANASATQAGTALTGAESARDATVAAAGGSELSAQAAANAATASAQSAADAEAAALDVVTRADAGEFKGDQGLPGNATMRVDTTVGTRVFITNGVAEHMIKGDTGLRNLSGIPNVRAYRIMRTGGTVTILLEVQQVAQAPLLSPISVSIPPGFRPPLDMYLPRTYANHQAGLFGGNVAVYGVPVGGISQLAVTYQTIEAWPTTLPGTPV